MLSRNGSMAVQAGIRGYGPRVTCTRMKCAGRPETGSRERTVTNSMPSPVRMVCTSTVTGRLQLSVQSTRLVDTWTSYGLQVGTVEIHPLQLARAAVCPINASRVCHRGRSQPNPQDARAMHALPYAPGFQRRRAKCGKDGKNRRDGDRGVRRATRRLRPTRRSNKRDRGSASNCRGGRRKRRSARTAATWDAWVCE